MTAPSVPLIIMAGLLVVQIIFARKLNGAQGLLIGAQAIFWMLAFVLRPAYLVIFQPLSVPELADTRLVWTQYDSALGQVMWLCVIGQAVYLAAAFLYYRAQRPRTTEKGPATGLSSWGPELIWVALGLWSIGWIGRIGAAMQLGSLDSAFRIFATVGGALLIVTLSFKNKASTTFLVTMLVLIEELWAFSYASKASMVIPLLALCLRWLLTDKISSFGRRATALGLIALLGFLVIQPMRGISTAEKVASSASSDYAEAKGAAVSVLERFDGLSAVTDALFLGPGRWSTSEEFATRILVNMVPTGAIEAKSVSTGQQWTQEVRAESNANQVMDVSLAAGPTAEGFAQGGTLGIVLENLLLAFVSMAVGSALQSRKTIRTAFAATFAFSTILFEQGALGLAATTNKAIQITLVALLITATVHSLSRVRTHSPGTEFRNV